MNCDVRMKLKANDKKTCSKKLVVKKHKLHVSKKSIQHCVYTGIILELLGTCSMLYAAQIGFVSVSSSPVLLPPNQTRVLTGKTVFAVEMVDNPTNPGEPFEKDGPGDYVAGSSTYAGDTIISAGRFFAKGAHGVNSTQTTTIASGATLAGPGPINTSIVHSNDGNSVVSPSGGGTNALAPSGATVPIGTDMTINGDYAPIGKTWLYFTPTLGDKVIITGAFDATNGTIYITPKPGYWPSAASGGAPYTAITWNNTGSGIGESDNTWGYNPTNVTYTNGLPNSPIQTTTTLPDKIFVTNANPANPDYLELNVTATQANGAISFKFSGIDKVLSTTIPISSSELTKVTGSIVAGNGATIQGDAGTTSAIATKLDIAPGGTANIAPAANATMEFSGEIAGGNLNLAGASGSAVKFEGDNPSYTGTVAATDVKAAFNGDMRGTAVSAGAGSTISGSGRVGAVTAVGATLKPGNSVGTSTMASLNATDTHYTVEMNTTAANKIDVSGNATLGSGVVVDVLMDAGYSGTTFDSYGNPDDTSSPVVDLIYPIGVTSRPIIIAGGTLTGNVSELTWEPQTGLEFDIGLDTVTKTISLVSTITTPVTIIANETAAGTAKRRILTGETAAASSLSSYQYISLIGSTLTTGAATVAQPISIAGNSTIETTSGAVTTFSGALKGSSGTLTLNGGGTTRLTANNTGLASAVAISSSTATIAAGSDLGSGALGLTGGTVNVEAGGSLSNAVTGNSASTLNLQTGVSPITVNTTLSGAMPVNISGTGIANINSTNTNTGAVTVGAATVNLGSGKNLGTGALGLTGSTINFAGTTTLNNSAVTVAGTGTTTLTAAAGTTTFAHAITQTAASTLNINGAGATVIGGVITTPAGGTVNLGGTGQTTINAAMVSNAAASLNVTSGKTVSVTVANPNLAGTVAVGSSATVNVASGADVGVGSLGLTGATVNVTAGGALRNTTVTGDSTSQMNLQAGGSVITVASAFRSCCYQRHRYRRIHRVKHQPYRGCDNGNWINRHNRIRF